MVYSVSTILLQITDGPVVKAWLGIEEKQTNNKLKARRSSS